jgi:hypothetical protein
LNPTCFLWHTLVAGLCLRDISMIVITAFLLLGPRAVYGPAMPVSFLTNVKPQNVAVTHSWASGCYAVTFSYEISKSPDEIAALWGREKEVSPIGKLVDHRAFANSRSERGMTQTLSAIARDPGTGEKAPRTWITLSEAPDPNRAPSAWYGPGLSPQPPVPLVDVPFLKGVHSSSVSLTSLEGLLSMSGRMFKGTDAAVFSATVGMPTSRVTAALDRWSNGHGYRLTQYGSYFKAGSGIFEIVVNPSYPDYRHTSTITMYSTEKRAATPIARIKD